MFFMQMSSAQAWHISTVIVQIIENNVYMCM